MELRGRLASVVSLLCPSKKRSVLPYANLLRPLVFGGPSSDASLFAARQYGWGRILLMTKNLGITRGMDTGDEAITRVG